MEQAADFCFYALTGIAGLVWGYHYIPEIKGLSLENIEDFWRKGGKPRELSNQK